MSFARYAEYKDSGVEWLGQVPAHWAVDRIKWSSISCQNGIWGDEPKGDDDDIACVRVADFDRQKLSVSLDSPTVRGITSKERIGRLLTRGDLLIEKSGGGENQPVGCVVRYEDDQPAVCSNFVAVIKLAAEMDSSFWRYVHAAAYAVRLNAKSIKQTSGIQNLDASQYFDERAAFPSEHEQTAIAAFLDRETGKIDALVAEQQKLIALLKEKRQAVISHAVTKGLNAQAPMKPSGIEWLGDVPAHWDVLPLKRAIVFQRGHDLSADSREEGAVPIISSAGLIGFHSSAQAKGPGLVTGRYGSIGEFHLIETDYWPLNTALYSIELCGNSPRFLWYLLQSVSEHFVLHSIKSAVPGIDRNDIHAVEIVVAARNEQNQIVAVLDKATAEIECLSNEAENAIALLKERRSALISAAVTGQIDVRGLVGRDSSRQPSAIVGMNPDLREG